MDIPDFIMLGDGFSIFHLAQEDKSHPWQTSFQLLLTTERDKGEAIVLLGCIGLRADIRIESRHP